MLVEIRLLVPALIATLAFSLPAQSSSFFGDPNLFESPEKKMELFAKKQDDRLNKIEEIEKQLQSERERISNLEFAPDRFRDEIYKAISEFTETELKTVLEGDISKLVSPEARARAESVLARVAQFNTLHANYQKQLDHLSLVELDYFIEGTMVSMNALNESLLENNFVKAKLLIVREQLFTLATNEYQRYMRYRLEIGDPRDGPNRTDAYRSFFVAAKDYFDFVNKVSEPKTLKVFWTHLRIKSRVFFSMLSTAIRITPGMLKIGYLAATRNQGTPERSPLINSIDSVFKKVGKITGHTVKIEGSEHLPPNGKPDGKTIYIIAPTHRDPVRDGIIMANLGMSNYLLAMAADQMMPKMWADIFTSNPNIVTVGRGSGTPITKILEELKRGLTDKIMIYPEGSVSAGLYETRPVREKFSWGLIDALQKEGYDVKLIPLTYKNSGQFVHRNTVAGFFRYTDSNSDRELVVKVSPPVDSNTLKLIAKATKATAIGNFIRATWLQGLPHNEDFNSGLMRVNAAAREFKSELGISLVPGGLQCKRFYAK